MTFAVVFHRSKNEDNHTCITFKPDLARFGMDALGRDVVALFTKRAYDMAGVLVCVVITLGRSYRQTSVRTFSTYIYILT